MFSDQEELVLAGLTELSERLLEARRQIYLLTQQIDRLRRFEVAVTSTARWRNDIRPVLAAITWAKDLEEARDLAARALRDDVDHDVLPVSDAPSISDNGLTSKGEKHE